MIEYLEKLVEDSEYERALKTAEQLLLNRENTPSDLLRIYISCLVCRFETGEFHGALVSGQLALKLATDLEQWDQHGQACHYLGLAHLRLGHTESAMDSWYSYLGLVSRYHKALKHEAMVWHNLGTIYFHQGHVDGALDSYRKAIDAAVRKGNSRHIHGLRHALISAYIRTETYDQVPPLLAKCLHYLRNNPGAPDFEQSRMWHYVLRVEYALKTLRYARAKRLALFGLAFSTTPLAKYHFYMLLARMSRLQGQLEDALGHAVMARHNAIHSRRFDLELQAAEFMYEVMSVSEEPGLDGVFRSRILSSRLQESQFQL